MIVLVHGQQYAQALQLLHREQARHREQPLSPEEQEQRILHARLCPFVAQHPATPAGQAALVTAVIVICGCSGNYPHLSSERPVPPPDLHELIIDAHQQIMQGDFCDIGEFCFLNSI